MRRFIVNSENIRDGKVYIYGDAGHISRVLRMNEGDVVAVCDGRSAPAGRGIAYTARLCKVDARECVADIIGEVAVTGEMPVKVTLFQCLPKSGKMEVIIQKCVELGVFEVVPVMSERCVVKLRGERGELRVERWQKVAMEAVKQCGRGVVPEVHEPVTFKEALSMANELDLCVMPYEEFGKDGARDFKRILQSAGKPSTVGLIVGPEGGFTPAEAEAAEACGVRLAGLGERILRTETAGGCLLSMIMYEYEFENNT